MEMKKDLNSTLLRNREPIFKNIEQFVSVVFGLIDYLNKPYTKNFVIDASITGTENLKHKIAKICSTNSKIIITSITRKELLNLKKYNGEANTREDAKYILGLAAENEKKFINVLIDETLETPDDCIVKYCADNKRTTILLTSDIEMTLKARACGVKVKYIKQTNSSNSSKSNLRALFQAERIGNKLVLHNFRSENRLIRVISNGIEYTDGSVDLKIGDDVLIAKKYSDFILFLHYKIISLYATNNCKVVYYRRIYNMQDCNNLQNASYKSFIKDFIHEYNIEY